MPATNVMFIQKAIKSCFYELINQIAPKSKQAKTKAHRLYTGIAPQTHLNLLGQKLEVVATRSPDTSIVDLLIGLNDVAKEYNKKQLSVLDEISASWIT